MPAREVTKARKPASRAKPPKSSSQKILNAAVELLRSGGNLSMRKLAQTAGVAGQTPYNVFGSKQGLLVALSQRQLDWANQQLDRVKERDSLQRVFLSLDAGYESFNADPIYYRALYEAAYTSSDPSMVEVFQAPRIVFWQNLFESCRAEGYLVEACPSGSLTQILMYTYTGAIRRWIDESISTRQLYAEVNYVLMILLLAYATPAAQDRLKARMRQWEAFLHE